MDNGVHGIVILGIGRCTIDQLLGLRRNATNGMTTNGVRIVVDAVVNERISNCILASRAFRDGNYVSNVVRAALGTIGEVLLIGIIGLDDGGTIVAFGVARDGVVGAVESNVAGQEAIETIVALTVAHVFCHEARNQLTDGVQGEGTTV